ncbi:MAG: hypothetical protein WA116_05650 [Anaerolineaceae bacterium]
MNNKILKVELRRAFLNPRWALIVLVSIAIFVISKTRFPAIALTNEFAPNSVNRLMLIMHYGELSFLAPLLAGIPYADSLLSDFQNRTIDFMVFRTKRGKYFRSKLLAIALTGGLCMVLMLIVMFLVGSLHGIDLTSGTFVTGRLGAVAPLGPFSDVFSTNPGLYLLYMILSAFAFGVTYALFGTAMSLGLKNKFIGLAFPLFFIQTIAFIGSRIFPVPWYLNPLQGLMPFDYSYADANNLIYQTLQYFMVLIPSLGIITMVCKSYGKK